MPTYRVRYEVRSGIGPGQAGVGETTVVALDSATARALAVGWAFSHDPLTDERIDPKVRVLSATVERC